MVSPDKKWPRPMKIFDPGSKCEKCGHDQVDTFYCGPPFRCSRFINHHPEPYVVEHHHRRCRRCGFDWIESVNQSSDKVIDLKEESKDEQGKKN